jgi:hypothetical protein
MWVIIATVVIVVALAVWYFWLRDTPPATADGAIVMALGIMLNGAFQQSQLLRTECGPFVVPLLFALLAWLAAGNTGAALNGTFYRRHLGHPIASFAIGTWVAAISVTVIAIVKELPQLHAAAVALFWPNLALWAAYMIIVARNYRRLWQEPRWLREASGVLLLACVATESLVISANRLYHSAALALFSEAFIAIGFVFYCVGAGFIALRYRRERHADLSEAWPTTNCILHGALSITGLACAVSGAFPWQVTAAIWLVVIALFIAVETVELLRGWFRVRKLGWRNGLFQYSPSQWSRNFTFGMLVAFTMNAMLADNPPAGWSWLTKLMAYVVEAGIYIVIGLFVLQSGLLAARLIERGFPANRPRPTRGFGGDFTPGQGV